VAEVLEEVGLDGERAVHAGMGVHGTQPPAGRVVAVDAVVDELPVGFSHAGLVNVAAQALGAAPVERAVRG